ncbi:NADH-quinone oxidoreductase subunit H [Thermoclostridium stercorarium]|nr:NADH-quinone oxidoreductase subunit H [Thermoclostridium stercorarium]
MLKIAWFIAIILSVPVIYIAYNYINSLMPGQSKTYALQPVYRLLKLFGKKDDGSNFPSYFFSAGACLFSLIALYMAVSGYNFLFVVSVLSMMDLLVITGAFSSNDFSGRVSAKRGLSRFIIWLFASIVSSATIYKVCRTLKLSEISRLSESNCIIIDLPFTFVSLFIILLMKGNLMHFDFGLSGTEMSVFGDALYSPYSGWSLAVIQMAQWIEMGVWIKILSYFLPVVKSVSYLIISVLYLAFMLLDRFISTVEWKKAARLSWGWAAGMSLINFIYVFYF